MTNGIGLAGAARQVGGSRSAGRGQSPVRRGRAVDGAHRGALANPPPEFGNWNSIFVRFRRWTRAGVWERVLRVLHDDLDREHLMMDSTIVRAHQHSAGAKGAAAQAIGRSRGGLSTKLHLLVDALGQLVRIVLTEGQVHDATQAQAWLEGQRAERVIADKAYDADRIRQAVTDIGAHAVIPSTPAAPGRRLRQASLQGAPCHRVFHQQAQAVPAHRDPLRQDPDQLPRFHRIGRDRHRPPLMSTRPSARVPDQAVPPGDRRPQAGDGGGGGP